MVLLRDSCYGRNSIDKRPLWHSPGARPLEVASRLPWCSCNPCTRLTFTMLQPAVLWPVCVCNSAATGLIAMNTMTLRPAHHEREPEATSPSLLVLLGRIWPIRLYGLAPRTSGGSRAMQPQRPPSGSYSTPRTRHPIPVPTQLVPYCASLGGGHCSSLVLCFFAVASVKEEKRQKKKYWWNGFVAPLESV